MNTAHRVNRTTSFQTYFDNEDSYDHFYKIDDTYDDLIAHQEFIAREKNNRLIRQIKTMKDKQCVVEFRIKIIYIGCVLLILYCMIF
jgi:hypothetical protein